MNNYEWIFSGIGVTVIMWIILAIKKNKKTEVSKTSQSNKNVITINNNGSPSTNNSTQPKQNELV